MAYVVLNPEDDIKLTVNMKCFEIYPKKNLSLEAVLLTVNMKCFEILQHPFLKLLNIHINRKHEMF